MRTSHNNMMRTILAALLVVALGISLSPPSFSYGQDRPLPPVEGVDRITPTTVEQAKRLQAAVERLIQHVRPAVVGLQIGQAGGSGTLISPDGWIMTAAHVTNSVNARCDVFLADGTRLPGRTMGMNRQADYSLVKAEAGNRRLPFVPMGNSDAVVVGQWVVSMGHPLGTERSPFRPPVVRVGRVIATTASNGGHIVADAPLISGDSGGPMFDLVGNLVGVNVSIDISRVEVNNATPINPAKINLERMKAGESFGGRGASLADYDEGITKAYETLDAERFAEAEQAFQNIIQLDAARSDGYYHLACCYLRWMQKESGRRAQELREKAFQMLNQAVEKGWNNLDHMGWDPDMNVIRDTDEFRQIIVRIRRGLGQRPYLGLSGDETDGTGVRVSSIAERSAADRSGIRVGDIITAIDDAPIRVKQDLISLLGNKRPGDELTIAVTRGQQKLELTCILGGREDESTRPNRDSPVVRNLYQPIGAQISESVVRISANRRARGFGVIAREDGMILCKASEIAGRNVQISVRLSNGETHAAQKLAEDDQLDLAIIRIRAGNLKPITWGDERTIKLGQFLASVGTEAVPFSVGARSLDRYQTLRPQDAPFLGVGLEEVPNVDRHNLGIEGGALVTEVVARSGADRAGLQRGDIIIRVGDTPVKSPNDIVDTIRGKRIGDTLDFYIVRNGLEVERAFRATLGRRQGLLETPSNPFGALNPMNRIKGPVNDRADGFGEVIQHDGVVLPQQVGSPIVDVDGNVVGLNIGRSDRTKTYALPASVIKDVLPRLLRQADRAAEDF